MSDFISDLSVNTQIHDGVFFIRWHNPATKNALNRLMVLNLITALQQAEASDARVCVLLGGDTDFCSGNDLAEFAMGREVERAIAAEFFAPLQEFIRALATFKKPLLAAVNGWAVGIGATLLLHCDTVIAAPQAQFSFPFTRLGLCVECGASLLLPLRVGQGRAADWLLRAEAIEAAEALSAGLINRIDADPHSALADYAKTLAQRPLSALLAHRSLLRAPWADALAAAMAEEEKTFFELQRGDEFRTILATMSDKWRAKTS